MGFPAFEMEKVISNADKTPENLFKKDYPFNVPCEGIIKRQY